jgi:hypothetical protein
MSQRNVWTRRVGGSILVLSTAVNLSDQSALVVVAGFWLVWALAVAFLVRRELPLSLGRFVLRLVGIDQ